MGRLLRDREHELERRGGRVDADVEYLQWKARRDDAFALALGSDLRHVLGSGASRREGDGEGGAEERY